MSDTYVSAMGKSKSSSPPVSLTSTWKLSAHHTPYTTDLHVPILSTSKPILAVSASPEQHPDGDISDAVDGVRSVG